MHHPPETLIPRMLAVARGDEQADVVLADARIGHVQTGEVERASVALVGGWIAGIGKGYRGRVEDPLDGAFLLPGFIDAHVHLESSLVVPAEFARAVLPRGTTTVVSDPHEIANVHGLQGIRFMLDASEGLPLDVRVQASSCVPATPLGTAGARLEAGDLELLADHPRVIGLAEVMNFPGVIEGDPAVLAKIRAFRGRPIDGHAPGVGGHRLNAYAAAGPASDHESVTADEAREKLRRGLRLFLREATNARNLLDLLPALTPDSLDRVALCTDDRQPPDLLDEGGIDHCVRLCIEAGIEPLRAVRLATLNPAEFFGLGDRGLVAPGRRADLVVVDSLEEMRVRRVFAGGREVARDGTCLPFEPPSPAAPAPSMAVAMGEVKLTHDWTEERPHGAPQARVIEIREGQLVTGHAVEPASIHEGKIVADPARDLLVLAVVDRHTGSNRSGIGLVRGLGLREGAIGGTVAHDHHNLIVAGATEAAMRAVLARLVELGGGLAVADGRGRIQAELPLPVAGLMSPRPVEEVRALLDRVLEAARSLGSPLHDPFMALSFLGLEVIPHLKLTDRGLVDVDRFDVVPLEVGEHEKG